MPTTGHLKNETISQNRKGRLGVSASGSGHMAVFSVMGAYCNCADIVDDLLFASILGLECQFGKMAVKKGLTRSFGRSRYAFTFSTPFLMVRNP
jgi:hypothetical protein